MALSLALVETPRTEAKKLSYLEDRLRNVVAKAVCDHVVTQGFSSYDFRERFARSERVLKACRSREYHYMRLASWLLLAEHMDLSDRVLGQLKREIVR